MQNGLFNKPPLLTIRLSFASAEDLDAAPPN
jgi:hypothetical protein